MTEQTFLFFNLHIFCKLPTFVLRIVISADRQYIQNNFSKTYMLTRKMLGINALFFKVRRCRKLYYGWVIFVLYTILTTTSVHAQVHKKDSLYRQAILQGSTSSNCYFSYPQSSSDILPDYGDNASELRKLDEFIREALGDNTIHVRNVRLTGYCSIEGTYIYNKELSKERVESFHRYLSVAYPDVLSYPVSVKWEGEDWATLVILIKGSDMPQREEVLDIIHRVHVLLGREVLLMKLGAGDPYRYMEKEFFPLLRRVEICVEYDLRRTLEEKYNVKMNENEYEKTLEREKKQFLGEPVIVKPTIEERLVEKGSQEKSQGTFWHHYAASTVIKTNVLHGVVTGSPNLAMEFRTGFRHTFDIWASYNPWTFTGNRKLKHVLVQPEFRFWPKTAFVGHFFGVHAHWGLFNVGRVSQIPGLRHQRAEGWLFGGGVSYGYHHRFSERWAIEGTVGLGYAYLDYSKHECWNCGMKLRDKDRVYFGPTRVGINLIYIIK